MRTALMIVTLVTLLDVVGSAQKPAPVGGPLATAQALTCTFQSFVDTEWKDGSPQSVTSPQSFTFQIDSINIKKKTARIVSGQAFAPVSAFVTQTGLNVIEQTGYGNFLLTSVFTAGGTGDKLLAVHSRHLGDLQTAPSAFQHYGACEILK